MAASIFLWLRALCRVTPRRSVQKLLRGLRFCVPELAHDHDAQMLRGHATALLQLSQLTVATTAHRACSRHDRGQRELELSGGGRDESAPWRHRCP